MTDLNERLRRLEAMKGSQDALLLVLAAIGPDRLAEVLREGIYTLERQCVEAQAGDRVKCSKALPELRAALSELEGGLPAGAG